MRLVLIMLMLCALGCQGGTMIGYKAANTDWGAGFGVSGDLMSGDVQLTGGLNLRTLVCKIPWGAMQASPLCLTPPAPEAAPAQ